MESTNSLSLIHDALLEDGWKTYISPPPLFDGQLPPIPLEEQLQVANLKIKLAATDGTKSLRAGDIYEVNQDWNGTDHS